MMKRLFLLCVDAMMGRIRTIIAIILAVGVLGGCSDDDSFSTDRSNILTFEVDTLLLDTVFSSVASRTYTFWVFNKSADGIRIAQVRLEQGNQTGFRVNVDGTYLDNTTGSQVQGLEVRKGDSIRVFVELTSSYNGYDTPQLVEDNLLFTLESGVTQQVNLRAYSWDATLLDSVVISNDSTISSSMPLVIRQGLRVDSGATLTIIGPTTLYFSSGAGLDVYGQLHVEGSQGNEVVFRGDRIDYMFDYLPYDRVSGQWKGIRFYPSSSDNKIEYADIHSGEYGIQCDSAEYDSITPRFVLTNVTVHNCKGHGIYAVNSMFQLTNCQVTNTLGDCLAMYGGYANIVYCTLAQYYPFDSDRGVALRFANEYSDSPMPLYALNCINTIITGYSDDELMGSQTDADSAASFNYVFYNSLIRTPAITDSLELAGKFFDVIFESPDDSIEGKSHFVDIDADLQYYDFHLDSLSTARGKANISIGEMFTSVDRDGVERVDSADIGCYQYIAPIIDTEATEARRRR